jgi:hypothetical protein
MIPSSRSKPATLLTSQGWRVSGSMMAPMVRAPPAKRSPGGAAGTPGLIGARAPLVGVAAAW